MLQIERIEKLTKINHSQGSVNIPNLALPGSQIKTILIDQAVARLQLAQLFVVL
jgi:hypothetical protein